MERFHSRKVLNECLQPESKVRVAIVNAIEMTSIMNFFKINVLDLCVHRFTAIWCLNSATARSHPQLVRY